MRLIWKTACVLVVLPGLMSGCVTQWRSDYIPPEDCQPENLVAFQQLELPPELKDHILELDPEKVSDSDVREVLSRVPAPRIVKLQGGIPITVRAMISFSEFLEGMGYPEASLRNPGNGTYSINGYASSKRVAGVVAWYYEKEGLRPMIVGHSQGGFLTVRTLHQLAGHYSEEVHVYNPVTQAYEDRVEITDPVTGEVVAVTDLTVCYAAAWGVGGLARLIPANWTLTGKLHTIPDSVDAFTGYYIGLDLIGGDFLGFGPANHFKPNGNATIRNVQLPTGTDHVMLPATDHLLEDPEIVAWINDYTPTNRPRLDVKFESNDKHLLFAADIWHDIKKHWVLELQRVIRARRTSHHEH